MKRIEILTLFPEAVQSLLDSSILRRAQAKGIVELHAKDLRAFGLTKHRNVDDTPFGGGPGMLLRADVLEAALLDTCERAGGRENVKVIYASPRGISIAQGLCERFADWLVLGTDSFEKTDLESSAEETADKNRHLVFVCGRYEGIDERFVEKWVDFEFSLGDFILTGGELPSLAFVDGIVRLLPGVLGDERSSRQESFAQGLLEHPQYTKPRELNGVSAPEVLLEGHHLKIEEWQLRASLLLTFAFRPDLIRAHTGAGLPKWAKALLEDLKSRLELRSK
ncbi:MAG: tRNA (guanosine(37)-N1)-methyltransferase TrmD [Bdellovibrionota bacterium]